MARKPKYNKEDFVIEAVNKMLEKHGVDYKHILEYPVFYNGVWYPRDEIFEVRGSNLVVKEGNIIYRQIEKARENLVNEYNRLSSELDGEELDELKKNFNDNIMKIRMWHWYEYYTWTSSERDEFRSWFVAKCRKRFRMTKKIAEEEASSWLLGHGLRIVE